MASGIATSDNGRSPQSAAAGPDVDKYIERRLRKTRAQVKVVDLVTNLMILGVGVLVYLLAVAVLDAWIIDGGLGFWGRLLLLAGLAGGTIYFVGARLLPLLLRRINPVYAAHAIEQAKPSLKNSLVNFLLFRSHRETLPPVVYQAVERQAAAGIAHAPVETAVDRTKLIRIGYVLAGVMVIAAIYTFIAPNPLRSMARVVLPWAELAPPTRVTIDDVQPGAVTAMRGQKLPISADIRGLREDEQVLLYYTTADGQIVDQVIPLHVPPDRHRHAANLPEGDNGLQQDLHYQLKAGDAASPIYRVEVLATPTLIVESVDYEYPQYTGYSPRRADRQGDIKDLEGTKVTINALANMPIKEAMVDFNCDGGLDPRMQIDGNKASFTFMLALKEDDRRRPQFESYQLRFTSESGHKNPEPIQHRIEVIPDLPPEIAFVAPNKEEVNVQLNGAEKLELRALDPDFALGDLVLSATVGGKSVLEQSLMTKAPWQGKFEQSYRFAPKPLKLKDGDLVEYWATAKDNKTPKPNEAKTKKFRLRVVSPKFNQQNDQLAKNDQQQKQPDQAKPNDEQQNQQQQNQQNKPGQGQQNQQQQQDQQQNPNQQQGQQPNKDQQQQGKQDQQNGKGQQGDNQQQGQDQQQGEGKPGENHEQNNKPSEGQQQGGQDSQQSKGESGQQSQGSESSQGEGSAQQRSQPVPNDGSNDGEAIEEILKHQQEKQGGKSQGEQQSQSGQQQGQPSGEQNAENKPGDNSSANNKQQPGQQQQDKQGQSQQQKQQQQTQGKQPQDQQKQSQSSQDQQTKPQPGENQPGQQQQANQKPGEQQQGQSANDQQQKPGEQQGQQNKSGEPNKSPQGDQRSAAQQNQDKPAQQTGQRDQQSQGQKSQGDQSKDQQPQGQQQQQQNKPGENQQGQQTQDKQSQDQQSQGQKPEGQQNQQQQQAKDSQGQEPEQGQQQQQGKQSDQGQKSEQGQQSQQGENQQQGQQSQSKPDTKQQQQGQQSPENKGNQQPEPGEPTGQQNDPGAGQKQGDQPPPEAQGQNAPREKKSDNGEQQNKSGGSQENQQSPSNSPKQSDSKGDSEGDRSGGGKSGGGQRANQQGQGEAGQNTSAEQGAGQSREQGDGETSNEKGSDRQSEKPTGQKGDQQGKGSQDRAGGDNDASSKKGSGNPDHSDKPGKSPGRGSPIGGDPQGDNTAQGDPPPAEHGQEPGGDQANLDYARKATDLALEHLRDQLQKGDPDPALLDRLGWTRDDLQKFMQRWQKMKQDAQDSSPQGKVHQNQLNEALRSLGLRHERVTREGGSLRDTLRGNREAARTSPPPEYAEQLKAYTQGTSRAQQPSGR